MRHLKQHELLNKYVYLKDIYEYEHLITSTKRIFIVFDKDSDPDTRYCWCIKSIFERGLELWVKQTQIVVLPPIEQESVRLLYGSGPNK